MLCENGMRVRGSLPVSGGTVCTLLKTSEPFNPYTRGLSCFTELSLILQLPVVRAPVAAVGRRRIGEVTHTDLPALQIRVEIVEPPLPAFWTAA